MLELYFKSIITSLTTIFVLGMLFFITVIISKRSKIQKWGRFILIFILFGTAISGLSAVRDSYMADGALFSPTSLLSNLCSIAGGLIFLIGFITIFIKNQKFKRTGFYMISGFLVVQIITIESSRIIMKMADLI